MRVSVSLYAFYGYTAGQNMWRHPPCLVSRDGLWPCLWRCWLMFVTDLSSAFCTIYTLYKPKEYTCPWRPEPKDTYEVLYSIACSWWVRSWYVEFNLYYAYEKLSIFRIKNNRVDIILIITRLFPCMRILMAYVTICPLRQAILIWKSKVAFLGYINFLVLFNIPTHLWHD